MIDTQTQTPPLLLGPSEDNTVPRQSGCRGPEQKPP